ncbi:helix-turn-helix domain-containing protein [Larkinella arboricola]
MRYQQQKPSPALAPYVASFWMGEVDVSPEQIFHYRDIARSQAELLFLYEGTFDAPVTGVAGQGLHGPSSCPKPYRSSARTLGLFGVQFYPHALPELFSIPAINLANQSVDLADFSGRQQAALAEQIGLAGSFAERVRIMTLFLESRLQNAIPQNPAITSAIYQIRQTHGLINIRDLAQETAYSQRQFERLFKQQAGFSPKAYARIIRFESVIARYCQSTKSLTELAHECGYFDQARFNHDFKTFTGYNPSQFFSYLANPFSVAS